MLCVRAYSVECKLRNLLDVFEWTLDCELDVHTSRRACTHASSGRGQIRHIRAQCLRFRGRQHLHNKP
eukprot:5057897-Pleurochrysis_carterae.AAC.1